ncbi:sulfur-oxidizing protein SoxZ [Panacagrimonas perspica]|uniref:Sulfur-oxidizing protein SoxZ n=1 Tax=Panacagrimonas perspica TaxID=381431 RepID=A0A4S3K329_9GAMM|nr:thiosulfate oxidation carrier complex protein SoxZ [Panacagrimonas perspica]TDU26513.1 sulfur-oxidizing protein SoxZ [Panacagrimonas perspica]THD02124.1 thiosulfate oxidation carrier complex protein SoxZ [Panacagrimonas perspica]
MGSPMKIRAAIKDGRTEVKVLIAHPMETGFRKDPEGKTIPGHYINEVVAKHNDKVVLSAVWGPAVSQNPFIQFQFVGGTPGDSVSVTWKDNQGDSRTDQVALS